MKPDARLAIYQTKVSTIPSHPFIATAVSFRLMGIDCHASYPLNSENASSPGALTVYLNGRDTKKLEGRIEKHLTPFFARKKMTEITVPLINAYIAKRRAEVIIVPARRKGPERRKPVRNATINRELAWLKHMFRLAVDAGKLMTRPKITLLQEDNARQGFFEHEQYHAVLKHLPDELRPVVTFAYITGWRVKSESRAAPTASLSSRGGSSGASWCAAIDATSRSTAACGHSHRGRSTPP